jgi:hypothetical protein
VFIEFRQTCRIRIGSDSDSDSSNIQHLGYLNSADFIGHSCPAETARDAMTTLKAGNPSAYIDGEVGLLLLSLHC